MPQDALPPVVTTLDHLVLTVADIAVTRDFYERVMGMSAVAFTTPAGEVRHALRFGTSKINLHQQDAPFEPKARHPMAGSADLCFLTDVPLSAWQDHLAAQSVKVEGGPVPRTGAIGPLMSLYIRDPDGNLIEISTSR